MISLDKLCSRLPNIALVAPMRAGKDEFFLVLEELGFPVKRIAFGDAMKGMFRNTYPWIPTEPKPIELLQKFGQSLRSIDEDVFVKPTMSKLWFDQQLCKGQALELPTYVFTDVRQPNEFQAVRDAGFVTVRLEASEEVRIKRMLAQGEKVSKEILNAPTEQFLKSFNCDYTISNNGTREEFKKNIIELIYKIQSREVN